MLIKNILFNGLSYKAYFPQSYQERFAGISIFDTPPYGSCMIFTNPSGYLHMTNVKFPIEIYFISEDNKIVKHIPIFYPDSKPVIIPKCKYMIEFPV